MEGYLISTWKMAFEGVKKGQDLIRRGGTIHKAIMEAVNTVEDEPSYHSVG